MEASLGQLEWDMKYRVELIKLDHALNPLEQIMLYFLSVKKVENIKQISPNTLVHLHRTFRECGDDLWDPCLFVA